MLRSWRLHVGVLIVAYAAVAIAFSWPLAAAPGHARDGRTGGDTGVYVWNQWVFHHELVENRSFPYFTNVLFGPGHRTDLSLHNYTAFQNLVAAPFASFFGVVETFNIVYLLMVVLTAYSTFLLARHVTRGVPRSRSSPGCCSHGVPCWSPAAWATSASSRQRRSPSFCLILMRADGHKRLRDALALGLTMAWAATTDVYYAIFCLLIGAVVSGGSRGVDRTAGSCGLPAGARCPLGLNIAILCLAGLVVAIAATGGWELTLAGQTVRTRSLYTPVLVLTAFCPHSAGAAVPRVAGGTDQKRRPPLRRLDGRDGCRRRRLRRAHPVRGGSPHRSG